MVIAVGDIGSTIIWSASSGQMRNAAEKVHFVEGGQWREELVGTNALALSLKPSSLPVCSLTSTIWSLFMTGSVMQHL